ncbi:Cytochrome P450 77A1 (Fragment) [Linum grandiflorum]
MELIDISLAFAAVLFLSFWWRRSSSLTKPPLPPAVPGWPIVGNLFQVILGGRHFTFFIRDIRKKHGPIFTMNMGQRTMVVVTSPELIHEALVQRGSEFASRPPDSPIRLVFSIGKCAVNSAVYGPLWRVLRRNFVSELMSPVRVRQCSWIRDWAMESHMGQIRSDFKELGHVDVLNTCRFTMCRILACICFGAKISEEWIHDIDNITTEVMLICTPHLPDFFPILTPLFGKQMRRAKMLRKKQMECFLPLINSRKAFVEKGEQGPKFEKGEQGPNFEMASPVGAAYIDSLFGLDAPGRGPLGDDEMVTLCNEVFVAGMDTSTSVLQWAFFELVEHQSMQQKLYEEIVSKVGSDGRITEEHVDRMPYLTAIIKETLRMHSPAHFTLSHAPTVETELGGYRIPADVSVEFYVEWMTEDPTVWKDPDVFRPERFLDGDGVAVDMTGTKGEVKMLPFGAGRRTCPGLSLGVLHVNLMLAKMVQAFKWVPSPDYPPDPTEAFNFTVVMKNPLKAVIVPRG